MRSIRAAGTLGRMELVIAPLDPADDSTIDQVLATLAAAQAVDIPDYPPPCRHQFAGLVRHPVSSTRREFRVARLGGTAVGFLGLSLPLRDNTENCELELIVHPEYRRRGIGRQLHSYTLDLLRDLGRKRVTAMTNEALPGGPARDGAGGAFAAAVGAVNALTETRRRLDLSTVDNGEYEALLAAAWRAAAGYRLVTWSSPVPEEYVAGVAYLDGRMVTDAPMGDLAWEKEEIDATRVRESERARAARGMRSYEAGAVDERTGRLVALTAIGMTRSQTWHAEQWITIVDPEHRGHRLGTLVKLENLARIRAAEPELRVIDTWNAAVNENMISINEAMGFRPVDRWLNWQQEV
jgi:GNAT superfamily N-acetyltransferase